VSNKLNFNQNLNIDELISKCNIKYDGVKGYEIAKLELSDSDNYIKYITSRPKSNLFKIQIVILLLKDLENFIYLI
jgi:hypothetical protein